MILISDGEDNLSTHTRSDAIEMAQRTSVVIYTISTSHTNGFRCPRLIPAKWAIGKYHLTDGDKILQDLPRKPVVERSFLTTWMIWTSRFRTSATNFATSIPSRIFRRITCSMAAITKSASKCRTIRATRFGRAADILREPTLTCLRHRTLRVAERSNNLFVKISY